MNDISINKKAKAVERMSSNNFGLNGLNLDASVLIEPIGKLTLTGTIGTDLIIPESMSDSDIILKSDCEVKVNEIVSGNNSVSVRGNVLFTILLLGEDGTLGSVKTSEEFELKDFIEGADENSILIYCGSENTCNTRLVNPRKLNLSSDISVSICALSEINVSPTIKGTETIDDEVSLNRKLETVVCSDTYSFTEKAIPVSHDIHLDGNYPPMSEIIYSDVKIVPIEVSANANNINVKTKGVLSVIYKSEEGNIFALEKPIVLEKSLEADNADTYEWFVHGNASDVSAEISIDNYGDSKLIEVDFTYDIVLNGAKNVTAQIVTDAYSTQFECQTNAQNGESIVYKRAYGSSLSVNASVNRSDINADSVRNIMLGTVKVNSLAGVYSEEKKRLIIEATASISAVCENNITSDEDRKFSSITFDYPFKCELDIGDKLDNMNWDISLCITDARFRCDQAKIYCDFENDIRAAVTQSISHSYLTAISIDKSSQLCAPYAPITLCYPSGVETLWDIAKYYKVTPAGIAAANNLDANEISDKKVLLIPSYKKQSALYTKTV